MGDIMVKLPFRQVRSQLCGMQMRDIKKLCQIIMATTKLTMRAMMMMDIFGLCREQMT